MEEIVFEKKVEQFCENELNISSIRGTEKFEITKQKIMKIFEFGYFKGLVNKRLGGQEWGSLKIGIFNKVLAKYSPQLRTFLTVQGMSVISVAKWGNKELKEKLLPKMLDGRFICSFALSESNAGSDVSSLLCKAVVAGDDIIVTGKKKWISYAGIADGFLTFFKIDEKYSCSIIDKNNLSVTVNEIEGITSYEKTFISDVEFNECVVPQKRILGMMGFSLSLVAPYALNFGRYTVAWGALGISEKVFSLTIQHLQEREQFGKKLNELDIIKSLITDMIVKIKNMSSRCEDAAKANFNGSGGKILENWCAKYYCSKTCVEIADTSLQLNGAKGQLNNEINNLCREAKALEIIEGSTQICELSIADQYFVDLI